MKGFKLLLCASAALVPAAPAWAQADADASEVVIYEPVRPDIVVVGSGVTQFPENTGRAITKLNRDDLDRLQTVAVSDVLATVPGVSVTRNGGLGGFTGVRIRGAEGEQTLVLIDGVRVNDPSSPGGGFDFANLFAGAIDHVEVLRGPNSTVWGSQAIGGVVNIATSDGRSGFQARANAEGGGFGTVIANGSIAGGNEALTGAVTAGYISTDGISAAASGTEPDGYRQFGASARLNVRIVPGVTLDLRGYFADSRADLDGFPPPTYSFADTGEYATAQELYGYAGLSADLFGDAFHNRLAVTIADIDRDNYDPAAGTTPIFFGRGNSERYEYQGDARIARQLRLVFGAEHEDSRYTDGGPTIATGITSVYAQAIVDPVPMLTLNAGIRYDDHRDFGDHTSFGLSGALRPAEGTVIRANYGEGFKAPTLYQLHSFYGTPTLRPETARSYEFGADQAIGPVTLGATWFHRDTTNQIDFDLGTFTYGNIAQARAEGFELEVRTRSLGGFVLSGSYTHLTAENRSPGANLGKDLARRPRDFGSLSVDYRFPFDLNLGASLLVRGPSFDNASNTVRLPGYALVGLRAEMPLSERFSLYARVDNLFDKQYQTVAGYGTMGRAAYGGIRVKLD